jgi:hypothetical protein
MVAWRGRMANASARAPDMNVEYAVYCMEPVRLTVVLPIFLTRSSWRFRAGK